MTGADESPAAATAPRISGTALLATAGREAETHRPDRLFADPLAELFLASATAPAELTATDKTLRERVTRILGDMFTLRTRFFDDQLMRFADDGGRQCVILGAGLDSRAFRLRWPPGTTVFELDLPATLDYKDSVLAGTTHQPTCRRVTVPVDLTTDWATPLTRAGFDPSAPTAWLAEGLLLYLTAEQGDRLLATLTAHSAPRSVLLVEHVNYAAQTAPEGRAVAELTAALREPWRSHLDHPAQWLAQFGWHAHVRDIRELARIHHRPTPPLAGTNPADDRRIWCLAAAPARPAPTASVPDSTGTAAAADTATSRTLYAADLPVGTVIELGEYTLNRDDIVSFARQWDPQPFHLDHPSAARGMFGDITASGIHTLAVLQRLSVHGAYRYWSIIAARAIRNVHLTAPVYPDTTLRGTLRVTAVDDTHPQHALVTVTSILTHGATTVMTAETEIYIRKERPTARTQ